MKVKLVKKYGIPMNLMPCELYKALTPSNDEGEHDEESNAVAIGKLAALLVEKGILTIHEAIKACDDKYTLVEVSETK